MAGSSSRMLALLSLLQARRDWPGPVLAERLGVTARTVRRDIDRLRELGYAIEATRGVDGGYRLAPGAALPPLLLDDEQAVALAVALQHAPGSGIDLDGAAARALLTLRQVLPSHLRRRVDAVAFERGGADGPLVDPAVLEAASAAVRDERTLRFRYRDEPGPARRAEPHGVVARHGRWYLVAFDLDRDDWRTFRLDRLRVLDGGVPFAPRPIPGGGAAALVAAHAKGSRAADRWPCTGEVVLALPLAAVEPFADAGAATALDERRTRLVVGAWSWAAVLAAVARFDAPFVVVGPEQLRDAAHGLAARLEAATRPDSGRDQRDR